MISIYVIAISIAFLLFFGVIIGVIFSSRRYLKRK
jgi:uncharacterized protein YneF (UPF0154 family)